MFEDGTPDQLIKICDELDEIYTQKKIQEPVDQHTLVESVLKRRNKRSIFDSHGRSAQNE